MSDPQKDIETLAQSLQDLLSGDLKVGAGLLKVGASLKREGRNKAWVVKGLQSWLDETEDAVPILAAALGEAGVSKLKAWVDAQAAAEQATPPA